MLELSWLIVALPYAAFILIIFFGKRMPGKGAEIGIASVGACLLLSVAAFIKTTGEIMGGNDHFRYERSLNWLDFGRDRQLELGIAIDGLAVVMLVVVTLVSLMVHVYSTAYMKGDRRYTFFFAILSLFTGSMLNLVLANNLLQLLVGWEGVGICSYFLIGHWWEEKENSNAAIKAFLTTRLGDIGLMFGIFVLFFATGTFNISGIAGAVEEGAVSQGIITAGAVLLFAGAIGKSAQFPLHVWLPDAMAGPTPVSALIHAATMVVAGVYLVARMFTVFAASAAALNEVAIIGAITMVIAALLALVQQDLKRVLAYSTISQLGYMVAGLGVGAYTAGVFHIWTHAWFKALLFLGAGSVIHAVHSNNMSQMGGLRTKMPVTYATYMIGGLALAGFPPLAGFFSKDELITGAYEAASHGSAVGWFTFIAMLVTAFLTAAYVARMLASTFFGKPKYDESHVHPHESPRAMTVPLMILAVLAVAGGWVGIPGDANLFGQWVHFGEGHAAFSPAIAAGSTLLALAGFAVGWSMFRMGKFRFDIVKSPFAWFYKLLENKYYLDDIYMKGLVRPVRDKLSVAAYWINQKVLDNVINVAGSGALALGEVTYNKVDQPVIDGAVNGLASVTAFSGERLKFWQSGNVQFYAATFFVGISALIGIFILRS